MSDTMAHNSKNSKRSLDENDIEEMDCSEPVTKKEKTSSDTDVDMNTDSSTKTLGVISEEHILNFPIPIDGGKACIVKVFIYNIHYFTRSTYFMYIFLNFHVPDL